MRSPYVGTVAVLVGLAAGCSHPKPNEGDHLDLVLSDVAQRTHVASALEIWGKDRPRSTAPARTGADAPRHAPRRAATHHRAVVARRAPLGTPELVPTVAVAPAPVAAAQTAPEPAPEPTATQPAAPEPQQGHGGGGLGGILRGLGGVIILRGGHSGMDPCDEHDRHGGVMVPSMPGRGGRFPGGIVFLRER